MSKVGLAILMGLLILLVPVTMAFGHANDKNTGNAAVKDLGKEKKVDTDTDGTKKKVDTDTDKNKNVDTVYTDKNKNVDTVYTDDENNEGNHAVSAETSEKSLKKKSVTITHITKNTNINNKNVDTPANIAVDPSSTTIINTNNKNVDTPANIATVDTSYTTNLQTEITNMENQIVDLKIRLTALENRLKTNSIIVANTVLGTSPLHLAGVKARLALENY